MSSMTSGSRRLPVGLEGELMMMARVLALNRFSISRGRYWKPSSSKTGTSTGLPSTNSTMFG